MQRLAYCEQFDFIRSNNYTEWCEHALEGAYDWIDSMQNASSSPEESSLAANTNSTLDEATEEILLQKLMSDEEAFMLEATLKRPAVSPAQFIASTSEIPEEHAQSDEPAVPTQEEMIYAEFSDIPDASHVSIVQALEVEQPEHTIIAEEAAPAEVSDPSDTSHTTAEHSTEPEHAEHIPAPEEVIPFETSNPPDTPRDTAEQVTAPEQVQIEPDEQAIEVEQAGHTPAVGEFVPAEGDDAHNQESTQRSNQQHLQVTKPKRKRGFLRRLIAAFFHV